MFLYVQDEHLDRAAHFLADQLDGRAQVIKTSELIETGIFGASPASAT